MITPPYLKKGDTVAIVAPARKISSTELQPAINLLKSWQLNPIIGNTIDTEYFQFSGTTAQRVSDFNNQLKNKQIKAIWCARGGYGTTQIIDLINFSALKAHPKWIIGYSDITVLHQHIYKHCKMATIHATMPINVPNNTTQSLQSLYNTLFGKKNNYTWQSTPYNKKGTAKAPLIGGNLSVLYSLISSPSDFNFKNKILFLEDVDEYLYHIDRMLLALLRAKKLNHLAGLIIGSFTGLKDNTIPFGTDYYNIIQKNTTQFKYPISFNFEAGHQNNNLALLLGKKIFLDVNNTGTTLKY